jgi:hypothetical protein
VRERPGLLAAVLVQGEIGESLPALLAIPVGFGVTREENRGSGDVLALPFMPVGLPPEKALQGFATAFDEEAMRGHLQAVLFGAEQPRYVVEECRPRRPLYVPGEFCLLRYRFRARERGSDESLEPIVTARVFPSRGECAAYMSDKLAPLAERMRGRPEVVAYLAPAATIEPLHMAVQVWPVAGELPTLVDATDRARMTEILRQTLEPRFAVEDCKIELVSYRRRQRCVLRYVVDDGARRMIAYGKVSAVGNETPQDAILDALRRRLEERGVPERFTIPRPLGRFPELQLSLFEALPGEAHIGAALEARLRGDSQRGSLPLEEMVATCGHVAAAVHTSGVTTGPVRTLASELAGLLPEIELARRFVPSLGDRAQAWLGRIAAHASHSEPLRRCLAHGDFKHEQLLFDGASSGLVDFDAICQAEPALDLGKFLAHLRTEAQRIQERASVSSSLGEELAEQFLRAFVGAAGEHAEDESRLRARTTLYEAIALLRLTLRSQQDLDEARVRMTTGILEKRLEHLRTGSG